ncbi:QWRF motif-containing protein 7-like [Bidens hawaiensis]|uniref:QWRF motif-containing protein 7-like n=1 Tax=Bidens hawaiensis TaxID=980011 RepID=UPI00404AAFBC
MDHLRQSGSRHSAPSVGTRPPSRLTRYKGDDPNTSPSFTRSKTRSTSTNKARSYKDSDSNSNSMIHLPYPMTINTRVTSPAVKNKSTQDRGTNILPRRKPTSPFAWALSPGRFAPFPSPTPPVKSPSPGGRVGGECGGGGISGVFKYFRQKKTKTAEEADKRCFTLINNRLLQWRFVNARGEIAMSTVKTKSEKKLFNVWLEILAIRNSNMVKRMEVEKLKNDIKLHNIMNSQLFLLEKWSRLEAKNFEAVGRGVRKLSVASINIPLLHESKGDVADVRDALDTAATLLKNIECTIPKLSQEVEKSCNLLTGLSIIAKEETELLVHLQTWMTNVVSLKAKERSLRGQLIQTN